MEGKKKRTKKGFKTTKDKFRTTDKTKTGKKPIKVEKDKMNMDMGMKY
jgi:hypothetical protein